MKNSEGFITRNEIKRQADYIICVPYGTLQALYRYAPNKVYYNSGLYGWNYKCIFHTYLGYNFGIISGYRPFLKTNISREYTTELNSKYVNALKDITDYNSIGELSCSALNCMCSYFLATIGKLSITEKW
jgi:hypothetical protein